jgi:hypothetical protein
LPLLCFSGFHPERSEPAMALAFLVAILSEAKDLLPPQGQRPGIYQPRAKP